MCLPKEIRGEKVEYSTQKQHPTRKRVKPLAGTHGRKVKVHKSNKLVPSHRYLTVPVGTKKIKETKNI